ncbi:hypothetical protein LCGC14_2062220, partial [marine sediment metagenome]
KIIGEGRHLADVQQENVIRLLIRQDIYDLASQRSCFQVSLLTSPSSCGRSIIACKRYV